MFFSKKKPKGPVPVEEIQTMSRRGLSDREIIKKMKKQGYSYDEIEKAMLQAVKQGVSGGPEFQEIKQPSPDSFSLDDLYQQPAPQQAAPMAQEPEQFQEINTENVNPEAIIEELIEGVIEEKWEKFNKKIKEQEQNLENVSTLIRQLEQKLQAVKTDSIPKELELRSDVLNNRLDDLEVRIGGLEKAFKQFLPSLTRNIENLSAIIHEMKQKNEPYSHNPARVAHRA